MSVLYKKIYRTVLLVRIFWVTCFKSRKYRLFDPAGKCCVTRIYFQLICINSVQDTSLVKKPPGSWRDLGGIPPGFPPGPAEILAAGISLPVESAGGIARRDFGRRVFAPRRESRRDLGGITTGIPPRFWPPGFRFAPRIPAGTWREFLPRFWPPGFCFLPRIPSGSWRAHSPRFWSPRFPFLAENLAKIPPRFSARQD